MWLKIESFVDFLPEINGINLFTFEIPFNSLTKKN